MDKPSSAELEFLNPGIQPADQSVSANDSPNAATASGPAFSEANHPAHFTALLEANLLRIARECG